jgi:hypothetical protein
MKKLSIAFFNLLLAIPFLLIAQTVKIVQINERPLDSINIVGSYIRAFPSGFESGTLLILNADKTYLLKEHPDLREYTSQGKWYIEATKNSYGLYLTSDKINYGITEVIEQEDKNDSLKFFVEDNNGIPFDYAEVQVESPRLQLDTLGKGTFRSHGIGAFTIKDVLIPNKVFIDYRYEVINQKANTFHIRIKPKDNYYLYMKDLYWRIGSNFLYCPDNGMLLIKENVKIDSKKAK